LRIRAAQQDCLAHEIRMPSNHEIREHCVANAAPAVYQVRGSAHADPQW